MTVAEHPQHAATPVKISGMGRYLPERVVTAAEIEEMAKLPAGWVEGKTGVSERRWVNGESTSFMGAQAAREAISNANMKLDDIDLIINASFTPVMAIPDSSCFLHRELGLERSGVPSFSIHATCLSFLRALDTAAALIATGRHRNVLIVSAEVGSIGLNFDEPESAALFGDMAVAAIVTPTPQDEASALLTSRFETYSQGADLCVIRGGGTYRHPNAQHTKREDNLFHMDGPQVFRLAHRYVPNFMEELRPGLSSGLGTISRVVPHQASMFAIASMQRTLGIPDEAVVINVNKYGNCIAASIPGALYEAVGDGRITRGDEILLVGTGAGFAIGGTILVY
jgi:3-oxoacyl-[acyl-carrier-protein] synthase-3